MKAAPRIPPLLRLSVAATLILLTHLLEVDVESRIALWSDVFNMGHVLLLGAFSLVMLGISSDTLGGRLTGRLSHYAVAFSATVAIGVLSEALQVPGPRNADILDAARDAAGAFCFLGLTMTWDPALGPLWQRLGRWARPAFSVLIVAVLGYASVPALQWIKAFHHRNGMFPRLATFNSPWEQLFWTTRNASLEVAPAPAAWSQVGSPGQVGRVVFAPSSRSGFALNRVFPDWSAYQSLQASVFLDSEGQVSLLVEVEDAHFNGASDDRYIYETIIDPGLNRVVVPLDADHMLPTSRPLDLQRIAKTYFLTRDATRAITLYVDGIQLSR